MPKLIPVSQAAEIIREMYEGISVRHILNRHRLHPEEFYDTLDANIELREAYDRAQRARAEMVVEEVIDIADNEPDAVRSRVRVDARKWYAGKMVPKYGDRIDVNVSHVVDIGAALNDARRRAHSLNNDTPLDGTPDPKLEAKSPLQVLAEPIEAKYSVLLNTSNEKQTGFEPVKNEKPNEIEDEVPDEDWDIFL